MNKVTILEAKVTVSLAKYDKNHKKFIYTSKVVGEKAWRPKEPTNAAPPFNNGAFSGGPAVQQGKSFASLFQKEGQDHNTGAKVISISFKGSKYPLHCVNRSIHGVVKDLYVLNNLNSILSRSGMSNFGLSYVGGLSVLITLGDPGRVREVMSSNTESLSKAFSSFNVWKGEDLPSDRIVSLRISGVPVHLRDSSVFDQIGGLFGRVVQESNFSWLDPDNSECSMLVLVPLGKRIEETVILNWENRRFIAWVAENVTAWKPDLYGYNSSVDVNSDQESSESSDASTNDDHIEEGDNVEDEVEDGEIRSPVVNAPVSEEAVRSPSESHVNAGNEEPPDNETLDNVETLHGVHGKSKKRPDFNNGNIEVINSAATNLNSGPHLSVGNENGYYDNLNQDGPTPIIGLGKRNRANRSPPSTGSMQGPPTRGFFQNPDPGESSFDLNQSTPAAGFGYGESDGGECQSHPPSAAGTKRCQQEFQVILVLILLVSRASMMKSKRHQ
ncbi:hypothetical protein HanIR_Chr13g0662091 [Helianthus annuus]|nr:hypothetical protein HanIR_Chr13g0662091 [Helianthus annuus]